MNKLLLILASILFSGVTTKAQTWSALGSGMNGHVLALTVYNGNLIAGGNFNSAGWIPANYIAVWNGTSWDSLGSGMNESVYALTVYKDNLIAGGQFTIAGGNSANYLAEWSNNSGINQINSYNNNNELPYPNPSSSLIHLIYNLPAGIDNAEMVITNIYGQVFKTIAVGNTCNEILLYTKLLASGEYFYYVRSDNYVSSTNKFVISK